MDTIPMVPRFVVEPALAELARKLPPEGAIIVTDRVERLAPISSNLVRALGQAAAGLSVIMVAPTTEAERAEVERLTAIGQLRPIFHDPALPSFRHPKPVPLPEAVEDLVAAQARDMRRRIKLEKKAARHERRCGHHQELIDLLKGLEPRSYIILVQSDAYGRHVSRVIDRVCSHLFNGRFCWFIQTCAASEDEGAVLAGRPDYACGLPVIRTPGLALSWSRKCTQAQEAAAALAAKTEAERAEEAAKAEAERIAEVKRAEAAAMKAAHNRAVEEAERQARERVLTRLRAGPKIAGPMVEVDIVPPGYTVEDGLAVCEQILAELMAWFARSFGASDGLPDALPSERGDWLAGLRAELLASRRRAIVEQIPPDGAMIQVADIGHAEAFLDLIGDRHGEHLASRVMFSNLPTRLSGLAPNGDRPVFRDPAFRGNRAFGEAR